MTPTVDKEKVDNTTVASAVTPSSDAPVRTHFVPSQEPQKTQDAAAPNKKPKKFVSHGYHIHNELTYRAVDWLANSTVGVAMTYWASKTKSGQEIFGKRVGNFFKTVLSPVFKDEASLGKAAEGGKAITAIMAGGFTIIPIMMVLENKKNKKALIHWMDEKIYGRDKVAHDPRFKASYDAIDKEPRKGFWAGMASRGLALAPIIAITVIPKTNDGLTRYLYDPIGKGTQWMAEKVGIKPIKTIEKEVLVTRNGGKVWKNVLPDHSIGLPKKGVASPETDRLSKWDFLHRNIGFDFGMTIFYAILHEIAYKALATNNAKRHHHKVKIDASNPAVTTTAPTNAVPETQTTSTQDPSFGTATTTGTGAPKWSQTTTAKPRPEKAADHVTGIETRRTADPAIQAL